MIKRLLTRKSKGKRKNKDINEFPNRLKYTVVLLITVLSDRTDRGPIRQNGTSYA